MEESRLLWIEFEVAKSIDQRGILKQNPQFFFLFFYCDLVTRWITRFEKARTFKTIVASV